MRRLLLFVLLTLAAARSVSSPLLGAEGTRPNILLILADDAIVAELKTLLEHSKSSGRSRPLGP